MPLNSRAKGKRVELLVVKRLNRLGIPARRAQQYAGAQGAGDIEIPGARLVTEVKGREAHLHHSYLEQALKACRPGELPIAFTYENRGEVLAMTRLDDLCEVVRRLLDAAAIASREAGQ